MKVSHLRSVNQRLTAHERVPADLRLRGVVLGDRLGVGLAHVERDRLELRGALGPQLSENASNAAVSLPSPVQMTSPLAWSTTTVR